MQKVIFFTAGPQSTPAEVDAINLLSDAQYQVFVRNGAGDMAFGPRLEETDFVAGTVPASYEDVPVWNPGTGPGPGDPIAIKNSAGTVTVTGAVGDDGSAVLPAANAIGAEGSAVTIRDASGTTSPGTLGAITAGVLTTAQITAATATINKQGDNINLQTSSGGAAGSQVAMQITGGVAVGARLSETTAAVNNNAALTVPVTGTYTTTATFTVAGGVITGIVLS